MYVEYKDWRKEVLKRDNYNCQCCGKIGKNLNAHHIENYSNNKEKRLDVENGIALCQECHIKFHKRFGYFQNNSQQIEEYLSIGMKDCSIIRSKASIISPKR